MVSTQVVPSSCHLLLVLVAFVFLLMVGTDIFSLWVGGDVRSILHSARWTAGAQRRGASKDCSKGSACLDETFGALKAPQHLQVKKPKFYETFHVPEAEERGEQTCSNNNSGPNTRRP